MLAISPWQNRFLISSLPYGNRDDNIYMITALVLQYYRFEIHLRNVEAMMQCEIRHFFINDWLRWEGVHPVGLRGRRFAGLFMVLFIDTNYSELTL